jgi:hypothetical protein
MGSTIGMFEEVFGCFVGGGVMLMGQKLNWIFFVILSLLGFNSTADRISSKCVPTPTDPLTDEKVSPLASGNWVAKMTTELRFEHIEGSIEKQISMGLISDQGLEQILETKRWTSETVSYLSSKEGTIKLSHSNCSDFDWDPAELRIILSSGNWVVKIQNDKNSQ